MQIISVSPHADFYPMLSDEALEELAADIKANGQRDAVTVSPDGVLLDGRNRLAACKLAGVEPLIEVYDGDDEGAFVRSSNERRHQSTGSRAMSTALSLQADGLRNNGRWKYGTLNSEDLPNSATWEKAMRQAGLILDELPNLAPQVVDGTIALDDAYKQAKAQRDQREAEARAQAEFEANRARTEQEAQDFFESNKRAGDWYEEQLAGRFDTWQLAKTAYLEHDKQARWEEEKRRRAEEEARREHDEMIQRQARYVFAFVSNFQAGLDMRNDPYRQEILDACTPDTRTKFLHIEATYLKESK